MDGYEVEIERLRKASAAALQASEQARGVDLARTLSVVVDALPGSRSAQTATRVIDVWERRMQSWIRESRSYGDKVKAAADLYQKSEKEAEANLSEFWHFLGGWS